MSTKRHCDICGEEKECITHVYANFKGVEKVYIDFDFRIPGVPRKMAFLCRFCANSASEIIKNLIIQEPK